MLGLSCRTAGYGKQQGVGIKREMGKVEGVKGEMRNGEAVDSRWSRNR
jgi:hypothetical protein